MKLRLGIFFAIVISVAVVSWRLYSVRSNDDNKAPIASTTQAVTASGLREVEAPSPPESPKSIAKTSMTVAPEPPENNHQDDYDTRYNRLDRNDFYPTLSSRVEAISRRRPDQTFSEREVLAALEAEAAWQGLDTAPTGLHLTEEEINDGREFIRFNPTKIEALMEGDTMTFPIEQLGKEFRVKIESVIEDGSTSLTWHGVLENGPEDALVSITQSEKITIAGIETPEGHYLLQAQDGVGWIASSATLFKVNPNEPDGLIPPDEEGDHVHDHEH